VRLISCESLTCRGVRSHRAVKRQQTCRHGSGTLRRKRRRMLTGLANTSPPPTVSFAGTFWSVLASSTTRSSVLSAPQYPCGGPLAGGSSRTLLLPTAAAGVGTATTSGSSRANAQVNETTAATLLAIAGRKSWSFSCRLLLADLRDDIVPADLVYRIATRLLYT
jgi:hypothetical protein